MNILEKSLEEIIDELKEEGIIIDDEKGNRAVEIIRSHMDNILDDGWIPVEERLPEESLNSVIGWDKNRERCVFVQFWNGRWIFGNDIEPVLITAWQPLPKPYKSE